MADSDVANKQFLMQFKTITEKIVIGKTPHMERVNWTGNAGTSSNFTGKMLRISNKIGVLDVHCTVHHISEGKAEE